MNDVAALAGELQSRRRRERSDSDRQATDKWLNKACLKASVSPSDVEDLYMQEIHANYSDRGW